MMNPVNKGYKNMENRRQLIMSAATCGVFAPGLVACTSGASEQDAARALRHPAAVLSGNAGSEDSAALKRELVRCATLAPSSHNTQCWKFGIEPDAISIHPDLTRRCPAVDR